MLFALATLIKCTYKHSVISTYTHMSNIPISITVILGGNARNEIPYSPPNPKPPLSLWWKGLTQVRTSAHDKRAL